VRPIPVTLRAKETKWSVVVGLDRATASSSSSCSIDARGLFLPVAACA